MSVRCRCSIVQAAGKGFDCDMIHAGGSCVGSDAFERRAEVVPVVEFVDQAMPSASSDSVVQSRQHAPCPHARFGPLPAAADVSVGSSLWPPRRPRHCVRFGFLACGHGPSIFLRPLARPALPGFTATMGALTPEQAALRRPLPLAKRRRSTHEHRLEICSGLPALRDRPSEHSIPNHLTAPAVALTHNPSARQAFWASPRMRRLAGRPCRNGFVLLRTAHSLPVAFHPSSRRRSYFQVQAGVCMPEEDFHLSGQSRSQAHSSRT